MSKRGNSRDLSKNACTRACTHSRPPGLRQTVGGEAVSPALAPAAVGLPLLPAADNAGRTQALSSELVASQGLPRTLAAARAPSLDLPIREVRSGGCHAVSSTRTLGNLGARMGGTTRPTPWSVATARPREVQRLVPAHTAHGRQVKVSNPVQLLGPRCF